MNKIGGMGASGLCLAALGWLQGCDQAQTDQTVSPTEQVVTASDESIARGKEVEVEWIRGNDALLGKLGGHYFIAKDDDGYFLMYCPLTRGSGDAIMARSADIKGVQAWIADENSYAYIAFACSLSAAMYSRSGTVLTAEERALALATIERNPNASGEHHNAR